MRRTILLADDSPTIQRLVTNTFADADFELVAVSNGDAAVRKFNEIHPHVVLADIYMPGKTGYEVCTYVRQHPTVNNTPVILLVGAFDLFDEAKAKEIGATGHITKPFEPQALFSLVESVLPADEIAPDEMGTILIVPEAEPDTAKIKETEKTQVDRVDHRIPPEPTEEELIPTDQLEKMLRVEPPPPQPPVQETVENSDLLGLEALFPPPAPERPLPSQVSNQDIERIADRVIQKISSQVIESIAWELVPDIAEKIVREELKRTHEG